MTKLVPIRPKRLPALDLTMQERSTSPKAEANSPLNKTVVEDRRNLSMDTAGKNINP